MKSNLVLGPEILNGNIRSKVGIDKKSQWAIGTSWKNVFLGSGAGNIISGVTPLGNNCILCCIYGTSDNGRILRSTDNGDSWIFIEPGLDHKNNILGTIGSGICFFYNSTSCELYRSDDYGVRWTNLGILYGSIGYSNLIYLGGGKCLMTGSGIFYSTDYGVNWTNQGMPSGVTGIYGLVVINKDTVLLAGRHSSYTRYYFATSKDYGSTWGFINGSNSGAEYISDFIHCPDIDKFVIVASNRVGISSDMCKTVNFVGYVSGASECLGVIYVGGSILVSGEYPNPYLHISYDLGRTWNLLKDFGAPNTRVYGSCYLGNGRLLATTYPKPGIYISDIIPSTFETPFNESRKDISYVLETLGSPKALYPMVVEPSSTWGTRNILGTSIYDFSRNDNTLTTTGTGISPPFGEISPGKTMYFTLNGTNDYAYRANDTDFDFGNSLTDSAFSLIVALNPDNVTSRQIIGKWDVNNLREWRLFFDASGYPTLQLYDESVDKYIGRRDQTAFATGSWKILVATYDGSGICAGCKIYIDGVQLDDADYTDAGYVAMEAINTNLMVGALKNAAAYSEYYDGKMTWIGVAAKELSADEVWSLTQRLKGVLGV
jgi:hypothetical protein